MTKCNLFFVLVVLAVSALLLNGCSTRVRGGKTIRHYRKDIELGIGQEFRLAANPALSMPNVMLIPLQIRSESNARLFQARYERLLVSPA